MTRRSLLFAGTAAVLATRLSPPAFALPATVASTVGEIPAGGNWLRFAQTDAIVAWPAYLRSLPLLPTGNPVLDYRGNPTGMDPLRVVNLPLVAGDLQQCADSVLRLRASFVRTQGGDPAFRYTSGFVSRWSSWAKGDRPRVHGNLVKVTATGKEDGSDAAFEAWLADLFMYAGIYSLMRDTVAVDGGPPNVQPGDVVGYGGSPGHAVLILDTAREGDQLYILVGQGFMPAQSFHVCKGPVAGWFPVGGDTLLTQPLAVPWKGLRRFT